VCCSVLQCVVVCCSVLQCVAVCCSVLQCVAVCCRICGRSCNACQLARYAYRRSACHMYMCHSVGHTRISFCASDCGMWHVQCVSMKCVSYVHVCLTTHVSCTVCVNIVCFICACVLDNTCDMYSVCQYSAFHK